MNRQADRHRQKDREDRKTEGKEERRRGEGSEINITVVVRLTTVFQLDETIVKCR